MPSLCRQSVSGVATACMNVAAGSFGDAAVAAMAIVTKIANFTNAVLLGFGQGFQPVCGYNYGAGRYDRVREGFWFCVKTGTLILAVFAVAEWIAAPFLIELFRKGDPQGARYRHDGTALSVSDAVPERLADDQQHDDADHR